MFDKEELLKLMNENIYSDHSGNLHNLDVVAEMIFLKIKDMQEDLSMYEADHYNRQICGE